MLFLTEIIFLRGESLSCAEFWSNLIGNEELSHSIDIHGQRLKCQQRCELQTESAVITSSTFPIKATFPQHSYFCLVLKKVAKICSHPDKAKVFESNPDHRVNCQDILQANNTIKLCSSNGNPNETLVNRHQNVTNFLYDYAKTNFIVFETYFRDPFYTLIKRDEQMPFISFIGNAGGLLSLCMRLSLISIFEIFYHLINFGTERIQKKFEVK